MLNGLTSLGWDRLVYMSCNPSSLARDLEELIRLDSGYESKAPTPSTCFLRPSTLKPLCLWHATRCLGIGRASGSQTRKGRSVRSLHARGWLLTRKSCRISRKPLMLRGRLGDIDSAGIAHALTGFGDGIAECANHQGACREADRPMPAKQWEELNAHRQALWRVTRESRPFRRRPRGLSDPRSDD